MLRHRLRQQQYAIQHGNTASSFYPHALAAYERGSFFRAVYPVLPCRLLRCPQQVTFKYAYAGKPLSEAKEAMVYLDVAQTTEWIKSSTYHYKITLPAGDADITVKVSVGDWDSRDISADW